MNILKTYAPKLRRFLKNPVAYTYRVLRATPTGRLLRACLHHGHEHYCSVCESSIRKFLPYKDTDPVLCPVCDSHQRHRLIWTYFHKQTDLFDGRNKQVLHIAPERAFLKRMKQIGPGYLTADLMTPAMVKMDITDIQYPDNIFDVIYCSHVLEHVPKDREAMREFFRTLKPNGWAIFMVPIHDKPTYEDFSIVDPQERLQAFGQEDHVRIYGMDFVDRLEDTGFHVDVIGPAKFLSDDDINRMGLGSDLIFRCTKS